MMEEEKDIDNSEMEEEENEEKEVSENEESEEELEKSDSKKIKLPSSFKKLKSGFYEKGEGIGKMIKLFEKGFPKKQKPKQDKDPKVKLNDHNFDNQSYKNYPPFIDQKRNNKILQPPFNQQNFNQYENGFDYDQPRYFLNKNNVIQKNSEDKRKEFEEEANKVFKDPEYEIMETTSEDDENQKNEKILFNNQIELQKAMFANNRKLYVKMMEIQWNLMQMIENMQFSMEDIQEAKNKPQIPPINNTTDLDEFKKNFTEQMISIEYEIRELSNKIDLMNKEPDHQQQSNINEKPVVPPVQQQLNKNTLDKETQTIKPEYKIIKQNDELFNKKLNNANNSQPNINKRRINTYKMKNLS